MEGELIFVTIISTIGGLFGVWLINQNWYKRQEFKYKYMLKRQKLTQKGKLPASQVVEQPSPPTLFPSSHSSPETGCNTLLPADTNPRQNWRRTQNVIQPATPGCSRVLHNGLHNADDKRSVVRASAKLSSLQRASLNL